MAGPVGEVAARSDTGAHRLALARRERAICLGHSHLHRSVTPFAAPVPPSDHYYYYLSGGRWLHSRANQQQHSKPKSGSGRRSERQLKVSSWIAIVNLPFCLGMQTCLE